MARAIDHGMAAVLALFMVPLFFAFALFGSVTRSDGSMASALAMTILVGLGTGVLAGLLGIVRRGEDSHAP